MFVQEYLRAGVWNFVSQLRCCGFVAWYKQFCREAGVMGEGDVVVIAWGIEAPGSALGLTISLSHRLESARAGEPQQCYIAKIPPGKGQECDGPIPPSELERRKRI